MRRQRLPRATWCYRALLAGLVAVACDERDPAPDQPSRPILVLDTATVRLASATETLQVRVELAVTDEQQRLGLMARPSLSPEAGMLFLYPTTQPGSSGFWMFRTQIPLDIAFLDSTGAIRAIRAMAPCDSTYAAACPTYPAGVPYRAALEVNRGYFARHGIGIGDRVFLMDTVHAGVGAKGEPRGEP